ncbi:MAG TPA: hypothetical protein VHM65_05510, partial [Candidatus Lustribacter sp.]|nr:hypothetical protein [Candidatus Lustribacter sp.]
HAWPEQRDTRWDATFARVCTSQGVSVDRGLGAFEELTRESLAAGSPWPSPQLSTLSAGQPVEYSAGGRPGVRFTTNVGDPVLAPHARVRSGLAAVGRTADLLGVAQGWALAQPLVQLLTDPALPVPDGSRFWLWAGADLAVDRPPALKAYLSLHAGDIDGWPTRRVAALRAAGIPERGTVWAALACLRTACWGHEIGVGMGPDGRWGIKVYDELDRWRPDVLAHLLAACRLRGRVGDLAPEIPGVLRATTTTRRRAGIAIRVDPESGDVTEVTTAAAFPTPLVAREVLTGRVLAWLQASSRPSDPLRALAAAVAPEWEGAPAGARMLALFTRTIGRRGASTTVYVRPNVPARTAITTPVTTPVAAVAPTTAASLAMAPNGE